LVITARGLTKRYRETLAVDDLSFEVRPGEVTGFLGPNGSGKSTTMRLILGLDYPDAGRAMVNGRCYGDLSWPLREVGSLLAFLELTHGALEYQGAGRTAGPGADGAGRAEGTRR
jgi:ABC-type multidrug transport system ATPase subunit